MIAFVVHRSSPLLAGGFCCMLLAACAGDAGLHDSRRDADVRAGGLPQRAVIGGMDNVVAGDVIARYMDAQVRELQPLVDTLREGDGIIVSLPEKMLFKFNQADLEPKSRRTLRKIADILARYPKTQLTVIGHTDDLPIHTNAFPSNWELSAARAASVAKALTDSGVAAGHLVIQGQAQFKPLVANSNDVNRRTNRRGEISLLTD